MFNATAQTPIRVDLLSNSDTENGDVGQQGEGIEYDHTFCVDILTNKNNCANIKVMRLSVYAYEVGTPYSMNHCSQA